MEKNQKGILEIARMSEDEAREMIERIRWPNGVVCPHCGVEGESTKLNGKSHRAGLWQCRACRKQFTATTGTVMHRSRIPLVKWVLAIHLLCSSKKGLSALQVQRQLGFGSYQTAWHLCHRIRCAMSEGWDSTSKLGENKGIVEVDEAYSGGKARRGEPKGSPKRIPHKTPVMTLIDREKGIAVSVPVANVNAVTVKTVMEKHIDTSAKIMTDDAAVYDWTGDKFEGGHYTTTHSANEFSRKGKDKDGEPLSIHSNTAESYFSLMKRQHVGAHHKWSEQHFHRYLSELDFRWNRRKESDFDRTIATIQQIEGKRLMYSALPSGSPWQ